MNKTDVLNTIQSAHASLEELLAPLSESQFSTPTLEGQRSIKDILALFQNLPEEDLNSPHRFSSLEGRSLLALIASNSYDHYQEHAEQVRSWLHTTKANDAS